ncbi:hypothetical protein FHR92_002718 [Fontibacillus solani]|uniref:5-bromo-4-chloroindolyl phosphate hydrolysis protein n=2 Tax=Fontibacillus TaxID=995014 RepID=A0A1G7NCS0_9BACL|nr:MULTISPECIES: hypothetical protein [Fontibacillus]MBA9086245.1 hypothetical protein [Fontibacillus solani]SDF71848.1 hypothetical protein SAMN04488542_115109 [Fontibacillus panacisegetis]
MQLKYKLAISATAAGYIISLITSLILPVALVLLIPTAISIIGVLILSKQSIALKGPTTPAQTITEQKPTYEQNRVSEGLGIEETEHAIAQDPFWGPIQDYIDVLQEMIISEGQKDALDNEIVEKSLSLLTRIKHLIPQLKEMNAGNMNHNIQRLVFKDLNGAINPFLKLSGEGKRINRRLLLNGLKDIHTKLSSYVESIEQKDLIELQTRVELIHQRYGSAD